MKKTVTYKGNIFTYTLHDCREEGNGEKGYIAFVDLFKGCVTSTQNNSIRELEKQVRSAIKDWLEPTSLNVAERQRLESLERLVASKDYFYKAMAENVSDE
jgi:predicted RNase H-like HicB family nuclease